MLPHDIPVAYMQAQNKDRWGVRLVLRTSKSDTAVFGRRGGVKRGAAAASEAPRDLRDAEAFLRQAVFTESEAAAWLAHRRF